MSLSVPRPLAGLMNSRDPEEDHRAATPLELFFDLCFVVAVSQASTKLHESLVEVDLTHAIGNYALVFFAIWWAWMNFTWFASAFDPDDTVYRLTTLAQMAGVLVLAAGIPAGYETHDWVLGIAGYIIMRLAMVVNWLRAAASEPECRTTALIYAGGIVLAQVCWVIWLFLPPVLFWPAGVVFALLEISIPAVAESVTTTTWHREHIAERYGAFTLIVLGEAVLSATVALQAGLQHSQHVANLTLVAVCGLLVVFSVWWLYFDHSNGKKLRRLPVALLWGYSHYFIFASVAALGAGLEAIIATVLGEGAIDERVANLGLAIPLAVFLLLVWLVLDGPRRSRVADVTFPLGTALVLGCGFLPRGYIGIAVVCLLLVAATATASHLTAKAGSADA